MKLWLVTRTDPVGYDEHDSAVVAAGTEDEARNSPVGSTGQYYTTWTTPENLTVELIGEAIAGTKAGPILESFNAG